MPGLTIQYEPYYVKWLLLHIWAVKTQISLHICVVSLGLCCHLIDSTVANDFNHCHAEYIKMPHPLQIFSQSDNLIQTVDTNSHTD